MVVIGERKLKENLIINLNEAGAAVFNIMYGRGFVKSNGLLEALGFVDENTKVIIMCLVKRADCGGAFDMLNEKFKFNEPNTGIAFTVPVEALKF
jgi:hypothetical protein